MIQASELRHTIGTSEIIINKIHNKCWRASFKWWFLSDTSFVVDTELDAPTKERLEFKLNHLKETGVFLRN